ncbi:hypothetical protein LCGC14_1329370 [marine sediment metagenome]|uniref:Uncharacterized protein n=1 Tax=marine sediment metagenome TaxID=412755 RepID=A0A0F9NJL8_9ZZZZ
MRGVSTDCPHCGEGQLFPDTQEEGALSCLQCGNLVYNEAPSPYETDRRSRTDNRQVTRPFNEYRQTLTAEEFEEKFKDILDAETLKRLMEEPA